MFFNSASCNTALYNLVVTGSNIKWYNASSGGTLYSSPSTTALVNNTIYYALFFYAYLIFMYSVRYTIKVNRVLVIGLYSILGLLIVTHLCV